MFSFRLPAILLITGMAVALTCCDQTRVSPPVENVTIEHGNVKPDIDFQHLSRVLDTAVSDGLVDMKAYRVYEIADILHKQLCVLSISGPESSPELFGKKEDHLAYWLNARTAWTFRFMVMASESKDQGRDVTQPGNFPVDGRRMTLDAIDSEILKLGGYRFLVAAPGLPPDRAPLPGNIFTPDGVVAECIKSLNRFIDDDDRIVINVVNRSILFPPVIWQYRDELAQAYRETFGCKNSVNLSTSLLPLTSGSAKRRLQDAVGFTCHMKKP